MCDKAVDNYVHVLEFVPECYKTQEMNKAIYRCFLYLILFQIGIKFKACVTELFTKILLC